MFTSFLKITLRNLYREKLYALINISGLSIAIACCLILGLWLRSELTYDRHNVNHRQIFRIVDSGVFGVTPEVVSALGPLLVRNYPEIRESVRFADYNREGMSEIRQGDDVFRWEDILYADNNVFSVFTHDIIFGDPETALVDPASMAVSESFSRKYFGAANPVGETMILNDKNYKITLVFADLPENTSLKYDVLLPYHEKELGEAHAEKELENSQIHIISFCKTYLLMQEGYSAQDFKPISNAIYGKVGAPAPEFTSDQEYFYFLQPLADIHLNSDIPGENTGNKFYIYGFTVVAVFILLVACINYMNLATARAAKRAKEVGVRKIVGAGKGMLGLQFLGEAICFSVTALLFALVLLEIAISLTPINSLLNKHIELSFIQEPGLLLWMLGFSLAIGLVSGAYPALYLSAMPVLSALTVHRAGKRTIRFRQALVVIQFIITVCVIACTLLMALQMQYVSRKPLGFEKENKIIIPLVGRDLVSKIPTLKKELLKNSHILGITHTDMKFGQGAGKVNLMGMYGDEVTMSVMYVDDNFFGVMGMEMFSGRDFSKKLLTDIGRSVVVNKAMVKKMEWDEPLGQFLGTEKVIGVVKDFNFDSLHSPVEPMGITRFKDMIVESHMRHLILHISEENKSETLAFLEKKFEEFDPEHMFQYEFLDDILDAHYLSEKRLIKLIGSFGGICIFISCLGLFGLSAFTTEQRTKEIGIRKVLGASTWRIIRMLFRNIIYLILGGAVLGSLVSYFVMDEWLSSFAYRTSINPLVFFISALLAAGVAFLTVALQSYKAAQANPVNALRYE